MNMPALTAVTLTQWHCAGWDQVTKVSGSLATHGHLDTEHKGHKVGGRCNREYCRGDIIP